MGTYLNPGNDGFQAIRNGIYVDKTGLIDYINHTISTSSKLTCFSRPRRFGKSFAAKMLCAYYDRSCDSEALFAGLEISKMDSFSRHRNQYDVIFLDITWFISTTKDIRHVVSDLQSNVIRELQATFPDAADYTEPSLPRVLSDISDKTGRRFIIIIDEWDALFREAKHDDVLQKEYIQLLRGLFKGCQVPVAPVRQRPKRSGERISTDRMIAAAYMTGILPIKKYGTESALTDFNEFSMTNPSRLARYVGFTQEEVQSLCQTFHMDFETMRIWYDGYSFSRVQHVYSPNSVIKALQNEEYQNYWTSSETYESLKSYISMNLDGLKNAVVAMLGGQPQKVETLYFQNDLTSLTNKNHVLTLLVHLGYLAYDQKGKTVSIPNLEVADSFRLAVQDSGWEKIGTALENSEDLLAATIRGDCRAVENALEEIHYAKSSILEYNSENSLACAITIAYYTAERYYEILREFPSGKGFADIVFIPHRDTDKPAILIELKYNQSADAAIRQIKERRYAGKLSDYTGNLLLVGINYNKDSIGKKHECVIERFQE